MAHETEALNTCLDDEAIIHLLSGLMERDPLQFEKWVKALEGD